MKTVAFFDSCVFYSNSVRDLAMQLAVDDLYQIKWSLKIEQEIVKNIELNNPHLKGKLTNTVSRMRRASPDFECVATPATVSELKQTTTDKKDIEILAAAIDGSATHLITFNLKDFDISFASARGVIVLHPDEFFSKILNTNPMITASSIFEIIQRTKKPKLTNLIFSEYIKKNRMPKTAEIIAALP